MQQGSDQSHQNERPAQKLQYISLDLILADGRRNKRAVIQIAMAATLVILFGAIVTVLDDARAHSAVLATIMALSLIVVLVIATNLSSRTGIFSAILAVVLVIGAFLASMSLFDMTPLRERIGIIRAGESNETLVRNLTLLRLWLCWCPSLIVGTMALAISRRRDVIIGLCTAIPLGAASALLWGFNYSASRLSWLKIFKWPKLLSTGLLALVAVILTIILARAISDARDRRRMAVKEPVNSYTLGRD